MMSLCRRSHVSLFQNVCSQLASTLNREQLPRCIIAERDGVQPDHPVLQSEESPQTSESHQLVEMQRLEQIEVD